MLLIRKINNTNTDKIKQAFNYVLQNYRRKNGDFKLIDFRNLMQSDTDFVQAKVYYAIVGTFWK